MKDQVSQTEAEDPETGLSEAGIGSLMTCQEEAVKEDTVVKEVGVVMEVKVAEEGEREVEEGEREAEEGEREALLSESLETKEAILYHQRLPNQGGQLKVNILRLHFIVTHSFIRLTDGGLFSSNKNRYQY